MVDKPKCDQMLSNLQQYLEPVPIRRDPGDRVFWQNFRAD